MLLFRSRNGRNKDNVLPCRRAALRTGNGRNKVCCLAGEQHYGLRSLLVFPYLAALTLPFSTTCRVAVLTDTWIQNQNLEMSIKYLSRKFLFSKPYKIQTARAVWRFEAELPWIKHTHTCVCVCVCVCLYACVCVYVCVCVFMCMCFLIII